MLNTTYTQLRRSLEAREAEAREQPWAEKRPWTVESHVWWENGLVVVDLHDLGAGLAKQVIRDVLALRPKEGAVVFVHGRGRHSMSKTSVLAGVLRKELESVCADNSGMSFRTAGGGRIVWVSDPKRAPAWARGSWGLQVWLWLLSLLAAAVVALGHAIGLY